MPFTFSHPAAVLPFRYMPRRWLSMTGLVVGSIIPDFEYFIRLRVISEYSHTLGGLFYFDLPLAFLVSFVFHYIVRDTLYENLPEGLRSRFWRFEGFDWMQYVRTNFITVIFSILIGAFSHILWDSFTHKSGYTVVHFHPLRSVITILGSELPIYKILQHMSSLLGAIAVSLAIYQLPKTTPPLSRRSGNYWIIFFAISVLFILTRFQIGIGSNKFGNTVVVIISSLLSALIFTPLLQRVFRRSD